MSTSVTGRDFATFTAALQAAVNAGANPMPVGGNELVLPDGTGWGLLQTLAAMPGITVKTDEPEPAPAPAGPARTPATARAAKNASD